MILRVSLSTLSMTFFLFIPARPAAAGDGGCIDADKINEAIEKAGAHWTAGRTSMSCLSGTEMSKICPCTPRTSIRACLVSPGTTTKGETG
jgi:hypothetical protein